MASTVPTLQLPSQPIPPIVPPGDLIPTQQISTLQLSNLRVVTYNVWFDDYFFVERGKALLHLVYNTDADVVCLQEVLPKFVTTFLSNAILQAKYKHISDLTGNTVYPYGVVILSKYPFYRLRLFDLETNMARRFLLADFVINGQLVGVGTVHLESMNSGPTRAKQLRAISSILSKEHKHWILVGDFNFDSEINYGNAPGPIENGVLKEILPNAIDTWQHLNPGAPSSGKTYDSEVNLMLPYYERMRYDRVMVQSQQWVPLRAILLGTTSFQPDLWPSDHFGIFVEFIFKN